MLEQRFTGIDMHQTIIEHRPNHDRQPRQQGKKNSAAHNTQPYLRRDAQFTLPAQEQIVAQQIEGVIRRYRFICFHIVPTQHFKDNCGYRRIISRQLDILAYLSDLITCNVLLRNSSMAASILSTLD